MAEANKGPKDMTPNPLEEAEKAKKGKEETAAPAEPEAPAGPTPEEIAAQKAEEEQSSIMWTRALQVALLIGGAFLLFLGLSGEKLMSLPAVAGGLLFVLAAFIGTKLYPRIKKENASKLGSVLRFVLLGLASALAIFYIVQLFKPLSQKINMDVIMAVLAACFILFCIEFIVYMIHNPKKILSDILMFIATILSAGMILAFYWHFVVPAIVAAALAIALVLYAINKDPLKDDGRLGFRLSMAAITLLLSGLVLAYAAGIFNYAKQEVLSYTEITPAYNTAPKNLAWSNDSWALAYTVFNPKKGENTVNIIHGLTRGITEIKTTDENQLPRYLDPPVWNKNGNLLIFSGAESENGARNIWAASFNLTLMELPDNLREKYGDYTYNAIKMKEEKKKNIFTWFGKKKVEPLYTGEIETFEDQEAKLKYEKELRSKEPSAPPGLPKTLVTSFDKVIDMPSKAITHKTAWSPDAKSFVVAAAAKEDGDNNLWTTDTEKQEMSQLTKGFNKFMPLWSPDGSKILYVSRIDSYTFLEVKNDDGSDARELNVNRAKDKALFPLWNSQQNKVIYIKNNKFVIMNADSTNGQNLSKETLPDSPYWLTAEKKKVILNFTESGEIWRIWTINKDGKGNKEIFQRRCNGFSQPKWSYDGKAIAVGVNHKETGEIWRLDGTGGNELNLFTTKNAVTELEWGPSSERLAFIVKKGPAENTTLQEMWVVDKEATNPLRIYYTEKGKISNMTWDHQSKRLAFEETYHKFYFHDDVTTIRIVHAIDGELWELLPYEFFGKNPVWTDDGDVIAYVGWNNFIMPSMPGISSYKLWAARVQ
ncbi:MAG: PD40 domain-containing protein [Candidatus Goldbacteria bacterium]|nr:PD40 domain-containing protein [Candidatus Goldiibacteriota bacterium]